MRMTKIAVSIFALGVTATPLAHATNGMNLEGYGPVAAGMGGASMAYDNGTAAVMNNPATLGLMKEGSRLDVALGLLAPDITANMTGMPSAKSEATAFYMPALGYAKKSGQLTYGVGVFSQGGMGTEYAATSFMAAGSGEKTRSEVGVGRFIVPLAYQVDDKITVGGSLDFVWAGMDIKMALSGQQFTDMIAGFSTNGQLYGSASGSMITAFQGMMGGAPGNISGVNWARVDFSNNNAFTGQAKGNGSAFKLGGTYKVSNQLTLGATYHSKTSIGDLTTTSATMSMNVNVVGMGAATVPLTGRIAVHNFQWPQTIAFGAAYQANEQLLLVADYKNIGWKDVMKNFSMTFTADSSQANAMAAGMAGTTVDMTLNQNWKDQNVFQFGAAYKTSDVMTVRGGLNIANNPVPDLYMNPLFPAIARNHLTLGFGYATSKASSIDFSLVYMQKVSATNGQGAKVDFGGYTAQLLYGTMF